MKNLKMENTGNTNRNVSPSSTITIFSTDDSNSNEPNLASETQTQGEDIVQVAPGERMSTAGAAENSLFIMIPAILNSPPSYPLPYPLQHTGATSQLLIN
jgi:hypothetical protein